MTEYTIQATQLNSSIADQGGGEFYAEILTRNLHFYRFIEVQYLKFFSLILNNANIFHSFCR